MKRRIVFTVFILFLFLGSSGLIWADLGAFRRVKEQEKAPQFRLKDINDIEYKLSAFQGKVIGVVFWKNPGLRGQEELAILQDLYKKYHKTKGLEMMAIYVPQNDDKVLPEEITEMKKVLAAAGVTFPNVIDNGMKTFDSYGVIMLPSYAVIDKTGVIGAILPGLPTFGGEKLIRRRTEAMLGIEEKKKVVKEKYKPKGKAAFYYNFAHRMYVKGFNGKALSKLETSFKQDPNYFKPYRLAAIIYSAQKKTEKAITSFKKAIELAPKHIGLKMELAQLYFKNKMNDEAKQLYQEIIDKNPDSPDGHYGLGMIYQNLEKLEDARRELEIAKDIFMKQPVSEERASSFNPTRGHVHYVLGLLEKKEGKPDKAFDEFVQACQEYDKLVREFLPKSSGSK